MFSVVARLASTTIAAVRVNASSIVVTRVESALIDIHLAMFSFIAHFALATIAALDINTLSIVVTRVGFAFV